MFKIIKNNILNADWRNVKYENEYGTILSVAAYLNKKQVTAKVRFYNVPYLSKINADLIIISMPINENEQYGINIKFEEDIIKNLASKQNEEIRKYLDIAGKDVVSILSRWVSPGGIYDLLNFNVNKNIDMLASAFCKNFMDSEPDLICDKNKDITKELLKEDIIEQLSSFYISNITSFEELKSFVEISNLQNSAYFTNNV